MHPRSLVPRFLVAAAIATALIVDSGPVLAIAPTAVAPTTTESARPTLTHTTINRRLSPGAIDGREEATSVAAATSRRASVVGLGQATQHLAKAVAKPAPKKTRPTAHHVSYRGRNHVWIPALGINRSVVFFSCSSSGVNNYVYRWGCAGSNNVYLFGHAFSVFRSLHDAYVSGRLYRGMRVIYADGNGHVRTYSVRFWKVVSPTNGAWAYAAQSRPSMTLQTCVGSKSQYRLIVRLVAI